MNQQDRVDRERERIAFGQLVDWDSDAILGTVFFGPGDADRFPPLLTRTVETLLENGYLDPQDRHNNAPRASRLVEWVADVEDRYNSGQLEVGLIGYMVGPSRYDSRIALTGISIRSSGPLAADLKREVGREFNPDLLVVDDFDIQLQWD